MASAPAPITDPRAFAKTYTGEWGWLAVNGAVSVVAGFIALVYPGPTLLALSWIVGIALFFFGGSSIGRAIVTTHDDHGTRAMRVVTGALAILAGFVTLAQPGTTLLALILVLGFWWIATGVSEVAYGFMHEAHRVQHLLLGGLGVLAGLVIIVEPGIGAGTLAFLVGIFFLMRGVVELWIASLVRKMHRAL
jgi:uncharacterized membrane protein HdeD (DUF308 family)